MIFFLLYQIRLCSPFASPAGSFVCRKVKIDTVCVRLVGATNLLLLSFTLFKASETFAGHNADDVAETVLLNLLRGDLPRLGRCTNIMTGEEGSLPRVKPFKYTYEKEIVMYAYFKKLDYFSTECIYSPYAARGFAREFVKDLEVNHGSPTTQHCRADYGFSPIMLFPCFILSMALLYCSESST